jgi:hypothetical protein
VQISGAENVSGEERYFAGFARKQSQKRNQSQSQIKRKSKAADEGVRAKKNNVKNKN